MTSSLRQIDPGHVRLIAAATVRFAIRSGTALVGFVVMMAFGLILTDLLLQPITMFELTGAANSKEDAVRFYEDVNRGAVGALIGGGFSLGLGDPGQADKDPARRARQNAWRDYLVDERPALISQLFLLLLLFVPVLSCTSSFNQFSSDVASKGLRFQLFRTSRSSLFLGRFAGTVVYTWISTFILSATVALYIGSNVPGYELGPCLEWAAWCYFALAVASVPYIAMCAWISGTIDSLFGSLISCVMVISGVKLIAMFGKSAWSKIEYLEWLLPWGVQTHLMAPEAAYRLGAGAICLVYTVLFLFLGNYFFNRRDL